MNSLDQIAELLEDKDAHVRKSVVEVCEELFDFLQKSTSNDSKNDQKIMREKVLPQIEAMLLDDSKLLWDTALDFVTFVNSLHRCVTFSELRVSENCLSTGLHKTSKTNPRVTLSYLACQK